MQILTEMQAAIVNTCNKNRLLATMERKIRHSIINFFQSQKYVDRNSLQSPLHSFLKLYGLMNSIYKKPGE